MAWWMFVDGDLDEWLGFPETVLADGTARWWDYRQTSPPAWQDAGLTLQTAWDGLHLCLGLKVSDDVLVRDSGDAFWRDDEIEVWVDGNNDGQTWSALYDHHYTFNTDGHVTDRGSETDLAVAMQEVPGGWNVEVCAPRSHLPPGALVEGSEIGFSFGYRDDDDGGSWEDRLLWEGDEWNNATARSYGTILLGPPIDEITPTPTATPTAPPTATSTPTSLPAHTPSASPSPTGTNTPTTTPTATEPTTVTATPTATNTPTSLPTLTPSATPSPTGTNTPTITPTPTATPCRERSWLPLVLNG
jgi:hypothetical protein